MRDFKQEILKGGYDRIINVAENILLRPNDYKLLLKENFEAVKQALEKILVIYKQDGIYRYYYELPKVEHGFCNFERWQKGMLF